MNPIYLNYFNNSSPVGSHPFHRRSTHHCTIPTHHRPQSITQHNESTSNEQDAVPLVDAILQRGGATHETPFHVPGHKVDFHKFFIEY